MTCRIGLLRSRRWSTISSQATRRLGDSKRARLWWFWFQDYLPPALCGTILACLKSTTHYYQGLTDKGMRMSDKVVIHVGPAWSVHPGCSIIMEEHGPFVKRGISPYLP